MVTKNLVVTAKAGNNDISISFFVPSDGYYAGKLMTRVLIETDLQSPLSVSVVEYSVADLSELSTQEKNGLKNLLLTIRDKALTDLGFV